jgi:proline iminopeptidase
MLRHAQGKPTADSPECLTRRVKKGKESYLVGWGPNEYTPQGTLKDFDVTEQLKDIKEPTLVINGGNDLCTPYIAKYMYDHIPNSRWELFRECRHMCYVEANDEYVELMKEWLNAND